MKTRFLTIIITLTFCASFPIAAQNATESPTWIASDGRVIQAKFVKLAGESVIIEKDGTPFTVPFANLSPGSLEMAKKLAAETMEKSSKAGAPMTELGPQVVAFCDENLGKKVGDGECAALAVRALAKVGAAPMGKDAPNKGDYVWGGQVALIEGTRKGPQGAVGLGDVRAGDLVQFRDARFVFIFPGIFTKAKRENSISLAGRIRRKTCGVFSSS